MDEHCHAFTLFFVLFLRLFFRCFFFKHSLGKCATCCLLQTAVEQLQLVVSNNMYEPDSCMPQPKYSVPTYYPLTTAKTFSHTFGDNDCTFFLSELIKLEEWQKEKTLKCTYNHLLVIKFLSWSQSVEFLVARWTVSSHSALALNTVYPQFAFFLCSLVLGI